MQHAEQGHCIARATPSSSEFPEMLLGELDFDGIVANTPTLASQQEALQIEQRERNIADSLANLEFSTRRCVRCGYPITDWLVSCRVCGSVEFRSLTT